MARTITCTRRLEWDAMHRVPDHEGACRAFHGHRYAALVTCEGTPQDDGMIIDFGLVKKIIGSWIDEKWDHTALLYEGDEDPAVQAIIAANAKYGRPVYLMSRPPTAENIALELFEIASEKLSTYDLKVTSVVVYETPNCSAEVKID
jgi:6-pyruvoyltetrahydropterin/6-carboxytetrahydropterin synthase